MSLICERCKYKIEICKCLEHGLDEAQSIEDALAHRGLNKHPMSKEFKEAIISDGGKTDFYDIGNAKDVDDLCEHWSLKFDEGNCLKAIVGIAKGSRHSGTNNLRDARKLVHYANRILKRIENDK